MIEMIRDDNTGDENTYSIQDKIKLYYKQNTYTFIREKQSSGYSYNYNGFILKLHTDFIEFFDVFSIREFPVRIDDILTIEISRKKEIDETAAKHILNKYLENNK